jgi:hypothetical protein
MISINEDSNWASEWASPHFLLAVQKYTLYIPKDVMKTIMPEGPGHSTLNTLPLRLPIQMPPSIQLRAASNAYHPNPPKTIPQADKHPSPSQKNHPHPITNQLPS